MDRADKNLIADALYDHARTLQISIEQLAMVRQDRAAVTLRKRQDRCHEIANAIELSTGRVTGDDRATPDPFAAAA